MSVRRTCVLLRISRSAYYRDSIVRDDSEVRSVLWQLADKFPKYGFWQLFKRIRKLGHVWNHKRVYRVYKALELNLRRKFKKRLPARIKQPLYQPSVINDTWSVDFMSDSLVSGRRFRVFNVIDDCSREALLSEADTSLTAQRITQALDKLVELRGRPNTIRTDNGPEFIAQCFKDWCEKHGIKLHYIQPGKPTQNAYVERFNGTMRREFFDCYLFRNLKEVRYMIEDWLFDYNHQRPHTALNNQTPYEFDIMAK